MIPGLLRPFYTAHARLTIGRSDCSHNLRLHLNQTLYRLCDARRWQGWWWWTILDVDLHIYRLVYKQSYYTNRVTVMMMMMMRMMKTLVTCIANSSEQNP